MIFRRMIVNRKIKQKFCRVRDGNTEQKINIEFGFHNVVTYGGADGFINAHGDGYTVFDNILTEYVFDYSGRTISSATRTYSDMVLLSSSNVEYGILPAI